MTVTLSDPGVTRIVTLGRLSRLVAGRGKAVVYILGPYDHPPFKVGAAGDLANRFWDLQIAHPERLRLFGGAVTETRAAAAALEEAAHDALAWAWVRGEWYDAPLRLIDNSLRDETRARGLPAMSIRRFLIEEGHDYVVLPELL